MILVIFYSVLIVAQCILYTNEQLLGFVFLQCQLIKHDTITISKSSAGVAITGAPPHGRISPVYRHIGIYS